MKYIVYCTTNLVNNKIYIGVHQEENPEKFSGYIGCGVKITMPSTYMNPKTAFQYAVKKYGPKNFKRSILYIYDTAEGRFHEWISTSQCQTYLKSLEEGHISIYLALGLV